MGRHQEIDFSSPFPNAGTPAQGYPLALYPGFDDRVPLRLYLRLIWNRRWLILAMALATATMVTIRTVKQKPVYTALGTLEIQMPSTGAANIQDLLPSANVPDGYLQTQSKILSSNRLSDEVIDALNLPGEPEFGSLGSRWDQEKLFQQRLNVQVVKGSQLIQVGFESNDPALAAKIVNRLMDLYIKQVEDDRVEAASGASAWILDQLKETRQKLESSMDELTRYERDHHLLESPADRERLMDIDEERLQELQRELAAAEDVRITKEVLHRRVEGGDTQMLESPLLEENEKQEAVLQQKLAQLTSKYGANFPDVQQVQAELTEVHRIMAAEKGRLLQDSEATYESAVEQETLTRAEIEQQRKKVTGGSDDTMQDSILKRDVELNQQAYEGMLQKLQEASIAASLKTANAKVVDPAVPPAISSHPGFGRNVALSLLAGLFVGVGIAIFEEHMRDTIKTPGELEMDLGVPILGVVPAVSALAAAEAPEAFRKGFRVSKYGRRATDKLKSGQWFLLDRDGDNHSELSEAIRNLRTSLLFALEGKTPQALLFSSSLPCEGKTTLSSNISISLAQLGKRILMIEGDLRRPCLHRVFSIPNRIGLAEYLQNACELQDIVQSSHIPRLDVIVCGQRPSNPAELLSSERMRRLLQQTKLQYDLVVVDSPALLNMADPRILASYADSVVLVVRSRTTPRPLAQQARDSVRSAGAPILGVVLNQLESRDCEYSYSSDYLKTDPSAKVGHEQVSH